MVIDLLDLEPENLRASFPKVYQHLSVTVKAEREAEQRAHLFGTTQEYRAELVAFCKAAPRFSYMPSMA